MFPLFNLSNISLPTFYSMENMLIFINTPGFSFPDINLGHDPLDLVPMVCASRVSAGDPYSTPDVAVYICAPNFTKRSG